MIGYDPARQLLEVMFKGGRVYRYHDVPDGNAHDLMHADSVGKYFAANIKSVYRFDRMEDEATDGN